jgi:hypothetical protein
VRERTSRTGTFFLLNEKGQEASERGINRIRCGVSHSRRSRLRYLWTDCST